MKKLFVLAASMFCFASAANAQKFSVGSNNLTATLGFGSVSDLPLALSWEHGAYQFAPDHMLGVGAYLAFPGSAIAPAAECNYHFTGLDKFDIYAGVRYGFVMYNGHSNDYSTFNIGANYYLNSNWAINVEFGDGMGALTAGVTYRL